eukprot:gene48318-65545_t
MSMGYSKVTWSGQSAAFTEPTPPLSYQQSLFDTYCRTETKTPISGSPDQSGRQGVSMSKFADATLAVTGASGHLGRATIDQLL